MNALVNNVRLVGRLGHTPEVKTVGKDKKMSRFSLATNESYRNAKGEKMEETQWHNLVLWGKQAEIAGQYLEKGKEIAVDGRIVNRSYDDKDGQKRYITEIVVNGFLMLGDKRV